MDSLASNIDNAGNKNIKTINDNEAYDNDNNIKENITCCLNEQKFISNKTETLLYSESSADRQITTSNIFNKIVTLNYNDRNFKCYSTSQIKFEPIFFHELNSTYLDVLNEFKTKFIKKHHVGQHFIAKKDALLLNKLIGMVYISMSESQEKYKHLKSRNEYLESKFVNYNEVLKENDRLKSTLHKTVANLCTALGRKVDEHTDIQHLINICVALFATVHENNYIHIENNILNHTLGKHLCTLHIKGTTICDQILKDVEKLKKNVMIQNLKMAEQEEENIIIKSENDEKNAIIQSLQHHFLQDSNKFNWLSSQVSTLQEKSYIEKELFDGKLLIVEEINQIEGFNSVSAENSNLSDLIHILLRTILEKEEYLHYESRQQLQDIEDQNQQLTKELEELKEWQNHIENENEKLLNEIEEFKQQKRVFMNNENELHDLKEYLHKMQATSDQYHKEAKTLKRLLIEQQNEQNEKDIRYKDATELLNLLKSNLVEQTKKNEEMCLSYHEERDKWKNAYNEIESASKELTIRVYEKNDMVTMLQEETCNLQHELLLSRTHIEHLNNKIVLLENSIHEKTQTIQKLQVSKSSLKHNENSSYLIQNLNHLVYLMDTTLNELSICRKEMLKYEKLLFGIQETIERSLKAKDNCVVKHKKNCLEPYTKNRSLDYDKEVNNSSLNNSTMQEEIKYLKKSLMSKNCQITAVETIARSHLETATNSITLLTHTATNKEIQLNCVNNIMKKLESQARNYANNAARNQIQIECLADLFKKKKDTK